MAGAPSRMPVHFHRQLFACCTPATISSIASCFGDSYWSKKFAADEISPPESPTTCISTSLAPREELVYLTPDLLTLVARGPKHIFPFARGTARRL